jgi:hypothetical protein
MAATEAFRLHDWLISTAVWGPRCMASFTNYTLPAIRLAAQNIGGNLRMVVHTDAPRAMAPILSSDDIVLPVRHGKTNHHSLGDANREALHMARPGECVAFINADMVASVEVFAAAEKQFVAGKRIVMMAATRTLGGIPPVGAKSRELLEWTMAHRHPAISELFWGNGRSSCPWSLYFEDGPNIAMHGFHLHPFALVKDGTSSFYGVTIDRDLMDDISNDDTHIVTDIDEASFAELSPPERVFKLLHKPMTVETIAAWAKRQTSPPHRWAFTKSIGITGSGSVTDSARHCAAILAETNVQGPWIHMRNRSSALRQRRQ